MGWLWREDTAWFHDWTLKVETLRYSEKSRGIVTIYEIVFINEYFQYKIGDMPNIKVLKSYSTNASVGFTLGREKLPGFRLFVSWFPRS